MSSRLPKDLYEELGSAIRGDVFSRGESGFEDYSTVFNGNVRSLAQAVTVPLDAEDISKIILFCAKHSLTPSVRAGAYGTAGWAIGGDIIIDLSNLNDIDIEPPNADGSYTSLKDVAPANSKGKRAARSGTSGGKRRREDDVALRRYDQASQAVALFLRGAGPNPPGSEDTPSPHVRRRVEMTTPQSTGWPLSVAFHSHPMSIDPDTTLSVSDGSGSSSGNRSTPSTVTTSPSPPGNNSNVSETLRHPHHPSDPFGYLDDKKPSFLPAPPAPQAYPPPSMQRIWAPNASSILNSSSGPIVYAEPIHTHAFVTFGAGKRQKEIDIYTAQNKLPTKDPNVKIAYHVPFSAHPVGSSIMILGGFGFLSRLYGLSIDNLTEVEMVLADGRIVIVNKDDYPDLWWAIRGAGPAFGVVTRYKAKAYPVSAVFAGNLIYVFNTATTPSLIKHFRDCIKGASRELYVNVLLTAGPPGQESLVVIQMCYVGPREKGQEYLAAISSWSEEPCKLNEVHEKSFLHQQDSVAQVLSAKAGRQWFIRSALVTSLPDDIINETVKQFADTPKGCTWLFELAGGAIPDYEDTCVPKSQREATFTVAALHQWDMEVHDSRCIDSAERWIAGTLKPVQQGGPFPTFLGRHEPPERTMACFGSNWKRLCEIKELYDPKNLFSSTFWPLNAQGEAVDARIHEPPTP